MKFSSDQAGGFATPNLGVSTLSRRLGPLAGKVADAVSRQVRPDDVLSARARPTLFGTFDLFDLLSARRSASGAPKLQTQSQDIPGGKLLVATLDWEPPIKSLPSRHRRVHQERARPSSWCTAASRSR